MRNINKVALALLLASSLSSAYAATNKLYDDVPTNHWAYAAVEDLTSKGLLQGFPDGKFKGNKPMTRYDFALVVNRMLTRTNQLTENGNGISKKDLQSLEDLVSEFVNELETISDELNEVKEDVKQLETKVETVESNVEKIDEKVNNVSDRLGNVKVTGSLLAQNWDYQKTNRNIDDFQNVQVRLGFNAKPTDRVEADFSYVAYDKDLDSDTTDDVAKLTDNGSSVTRFGRTKGSNDVEVANLKLKNLFMDNDMIQIGRRFMTHGHALVLNDFSDAIGYSTKYRGVNLAVNAIFCDVSKGIYHTKGHETEDPEEHWKKGNQIWNINADYNLKGHNIYAGLYAQSQGDYFGENYKTGKEDKIYQDRSKFIAEFGSKGKITKDDKLTYDIAGVVSQNSRKNRINNNKKDEATGLLAHVGLGYKANDKFKGRFAFTTADEKFDGILSLDKTQGAMCGEHTTPFDDIARMQTLLGGMMNDKFYNTSDMKFELEYQIRHNQNLRFAYDIVKENDDKVKTGFTNNGQKQDNYNAAGYNKLDAKIATLEYKYQFDPSTRISVGYTSADKGSCRDANNLKMKDEQVFWTEVFSKF